MVADASTVQGHNLPYCMIKRCHSLDTGRVPCSCQQCCILRYRRTRYPISHVAVTELYGPSGLLRSCQQQRRIFRYRCNCSLLTPHIAVMGKCMGSQGLGIR